MGEAFGFIYFIQQGDDGPIKVGYTKKSVKTRLGLLQVGNPDELFVIKIIDGTVEDEARIHSIFYESRIRGEWFTPTLELKRFLKYLDGVSDKGNKAEIIDFDVLVKERQKLDDIRERAIKRANGR